MVFITMVFSYGKFYRVVYFTWYTMVFITMVFSYGKFYYVVYHGVYHVDFTYLW